jgi:hypothetical protein
VSIRTRNRHQALDFDREYGPLVPPSVNSQQASGLGLNTQPIPVATEITQSDDSTSFASTPSEQIAMASSSTLTPRRLPNIVITGTPGTGKVSRSASKKKNMNSIVLACSELTCLLG